MTYALITEAREMLMRELLAIKGIVMAIDAREEKAEPLDARVSRLEAIAFPEVREAKAEAPGAGEDCSAYYPAVRGMIEGDLDETMGFRFYVPVSKAIPDGVVFCEFRTRPIPRYQMSYGDMEPRLRLVKGGLSDV